MNPDAYFFLTADRIADLHRDADRRRLTSLATRGRRFTVRHGKAAATAGTPCPPLAGQRGVG